MGTAFFGSAGRAATPTLSHPTLSYSSPTRPPRPRASEATTFTGNIDLQPLSGSQWRVCDTRWPEHDARNLLGFIEHKKGLFEVVQINHGLTHLSFTSLADATAHFSRESQRAKDAS